MRRNMPVCQPLLIVRVFRSFLLFFPTDGEALRSVTILVTSVFLRVCLRRGVVYSTTYLQNGLEDYRHACFDFSSLPSRWAIYPGIVVVWIYRRVVSAVRWISSMEVGSGGMTDTCQSS